MSMRSIDSVKSVLTTETQVVFDHQHGRYYTYDSRTQESTWLEDDDPRCLAVKNAEGGLHYDCDMEF